MEWTVHVNAISIFKLVLQTGMLSEVNISVKRDNPVCIFQCKLRVNPAFNFPNFFFFFE